MRIDSHQHFWKFNPERDTWITDDMNVLKNDFSPADLLPLLKQNAVDGCVSVQADQSLSETDFLLELADRNEFIKGVVGWVDLRSGNLENTLAKYRRHKKLKGFRHIVQSEPEGFLSNDSFIAGVRKISEEGFTFDLLVYPHQLEESLYFVNRLPDAKIVIDHMAKPYIRKGEKTKWKTEMLALAKFSNVSCKVSGLVTEADWKSWNKQQIFPFIDEVLESFGADRLMYGSDWPVCLLAATYERQLEVVTSYIEALSADERQSIMGGTAMKFYDL
jgi:L-fuconolactonase